MPRAMLRVPWALPGLPAILTAVVLAGCDAGTGMIGLGSVPHAGAVDSVVVSPSSVTLTAIGQQQQFTATALDSLGLPVSGASFTWGSQDTTVVTVNGSGVAVAVRNGTTGVLAQSGNVSGLATVTVSAPAGVAPEPRRPAVP